MKLWLLVFALGFGYAFGYAPVSSAEDAKRVNTGLPPAEVVQDSSVLNLTDAQIGKMVLEEGRSGLDAGKLAQTKSKNNKIKEYAQGIIQSCNGMNQKTSELLKKVHLKADESPISNQLKIATNGQLEKLKKLSGAAFDRAYIDHEVRYHQSMMDTFDITLIPNAQNESLKSLLLEKIRPTILENLSNCQKIQDSLDQSSGLQSSDRQSSG